MTHGIIIICLSIDLSLYHIDYNFQKYMISYKLPLRTTIILYNYISSLFIIIINHVIYITDNTYVMVYDTTNFKFHKLSPFFNKWRQTKSNDISK